MAATVNAVTTAAASQNQPAAAPANQLTDKTTFLKLLVAQIKNQDPLNPADGLQFVSQLAQFSELEQLMEIREGIQQLSGQLTQPAATPDPASPEAPHN